MVVDVVVTSSITSMRPPIGRTLAVMSFPSLSVTRRSLKLTSNLSPAFASAGIMYSIVIIIAPFALGAPSPLSYANANSRVAGLQLSLAP